MKYLLDSREMKQCDANTMQRRGMLSAVLMERAAMAVAEEIMRARPDRGTTVLAVCGAGNNGGDGVAAARLLHLKGYRVDILFFGNEEKASEEAKRQLRIAGNYQVPLYREMPEKSYDVVVDALFGIGLARNVEGGYARLIGRMNAMSGLKVAVDIASGLSADDGSVMGTAFAADLTVTFGFAKIGQMLYPGAGLSGRVEVRDIGIDEYSLFDLNPRMRMPERADLSLLPRRIPHSNKGSYGKVLIFAGSHNMAGAAAFSAGAAYAAGAGLVKVVTPEENRTILQTLVPEAVLSTYRETTQMEAYVREQLEWADAVVAGPGIGRSVQAEELTKAVLRYANVPCVLDADALNILAAHREWLSLPQAPVIVTPHPGEMARLCALTVAGIQAGLPAAAREFAQQYHAVTVLKDARTVTALPQGDLYLNVSGNNGMAAGGSGDVLTGVIGALLGQKIPADTAAWLGVYVHGLAGDRAAARVGKAGLTAREIIEGIRKVLKECEEAADE